MKEIDMFLELVKKECWNARKNYPPFRTGEEGCGVLLEEANEVWDNIRHRPVNQESLIHDLVQVAAVCRMMVMELNLGNIDDFDIQCAEKQPKPFNTFHEGYVILMTGLSKLLYEISVGTDTNRERNFAELVFIYKTAERMFTTL